MLCEMDLCSRADVDAPPVLANLGFVLDSLSFPVRYASPFLANKRAWQCAWSVLQLSDLVTGDRSLGRCNVLWAARVTIW